jgi:hypothetical protein
MSKIAEIVPNVWRAKGGEMAKKPQPTPRAKAQMAGVLAGMMLGIPLADRSPQSNYNPVPPRPPAMTVPPKKKRGR